MPSTTLSSQPLPSFHILRKTSAVLALVLTLATVVLAQDAPRRHGIFIDAIDVSLIDLEVVVTRDGEPVTDLGPEDFEVLDDGVPVEITHFGRVVGGRREIDVAVSDAPLEAAAFEAVEKLPLAPREPATVVVLFDQPFLSPASRRRIVEELEGHLDPLLAAGARVLVATKNLDVAIVQEPTSDRARIIAALEQAASMAVSSQLHDSKVRLLLREIEQGSRPFTGIETGTDFGEKDARLSFQRTLAHAREDALEVRRAVRALGAFFDALGGLPGRKALLWVGDRLPLRPGEEVLAVWFARYGDDYGDVVGALSLDSVLKEHETHREIQELVAQASAAGLAVYPVGTRRGVAARAISAERSGGGLTPSALSLQAQPQNAGLEDLAAGTGGYAAVSTGAPGRLLDRLRSDLVHYYSLAYPTPHRGDGATHEVQVKVSRPGVQVRYLDTYRDLPADVQMRGRTVAALLHDTAENPLAASIAVGEIERLEKTKKDIFEVQLDVSFPLAKLVLLPEGERHLGRVSIWITARGSDGRMAPPQHIVAPIEIANTDLLDAIGRTALNRTVIALRGGEQTLAVGLRDEIGGTSSTLRLQLEVGR